MKNSTSVTQSMSVSANKSIGWSIDASLSGGYKTAFNAAVGASWQNTATISCELTVNVAPGLNFHQVIDMFAEKHKNIM